MYKRIRCFTRYIFKDKLFRFFYIFSQSHLFFNNLWMLSFNSSLKLSH